MGKPRLIILIRHAQSEGNKNREIHQMIPDHRVKLTDDGHKQARIAEEAGRRLRHLLKPDDTLQIFTSPYRRTRETTEGILKTLTARDDPDDPTAAPSPFSRSKIKVYEEPRLREQDFGNFQPCSAEMERMWQERADYGHFFYRIPNGESAADAYDRIAGFNESLWRQIGEKEFPSVCVLVTHGLMSRVFLMKWYHWSVEYFEDLRNVNHCEFVIMRQNMESGKYILESQLRTWSDLKRERAKERAEEARNNPSRRNTLSSFLKNAGNTASPDLKAKQWGGCVGGCDHQHEKYPRRELKDIGLPPAAEAVENSENEADDHPLGDKDAVPMDGTVEVSRSQSRRLPARAVPSYVRSGRDGGGEDSGANTPHEMSEDEGEYFSQAAKSTARRGGTGGSMQAALRRAPQRKATEEDFERWASESGMGRGKQADALGDEPGSDDDVDEAERQDKSLRGSVY